MCQFSCCQDLRHVCLRAWICTARRNGGGWCWRSWRRTYQWHIASSLDRPLAAERSDDNSWHWQAISQHWRNLESLPIHNTNTTTSYFLPYTGRYAYWQALQKILTDLRAVLVKLNENSSCIWSLGGLTCSQTHWNVFKLSSRCSKSYEILTTYAHYTTFATVHKHSLTQ